MPVPSPAVHRFPLTPPQAVPDTSAEVWQAAPGSAPAVVLAHGAGTGRAHPLLRAVAEGLARHAHPVAVFNFGYREAGRGRPDPPERLGRAWDDAIAALPPLLGATRPLVVGGRSMGGRIATMAAAAGAPVAGCIAMAYPLHPPGRPDRLRVAHWPDLAVPLLLLSGDRDAMAPLPSLRRELATHLDGRDVTLHVLAGADHSYRVRRRDRPDGQPGVVEEVVGTAAAWLAQRWPAVS